MTTATKERKKEKFDCKGYLEHMTRVDWDENMPFPKHNAVLTDVKKFNKWVKEQCPWMKDVPVFGSASNEDVLENAVKLGTMRLVVKRTPRTVMRAMYSGMLFAPLRERPFSWSIYNSSKSLDLFVDGIAYYPSLIDTGTHSWDTVMAMTPNELFTLRPMVRRAQGNVVIMGLGFGWLAERVLQRKKVKHVTIVEKSAEILEYFGPRLKELYGDKLTLVGGDAYEHAWDDYDVALWDIWNDARPYSHKFEQIREAMTNVGKVCVGWTYWADKPSSGW